MFNYFNKILFIILLLIYLHFGIVNNPSSISSSLIIFPKKCRRLINEIPSLSYFPSEIWRNGIGSIKLQGMKEPRLFMSDQFNFCEEAGGQYNFKPFYTDKAPQIKPNPSFDLTRLATALFWDLFPRGPNYAEYQNYYYYVVTIYNHFYAATDWLVI